MDAEWSQATIGRGRCQLRGVEKCNHLLRDFAVDDFFYKGVAQLLSPARVPRRSFDLTHFALRGAASLSFPAHIDCAIFLLFTSISSEAAGVVSIARIERPPLHRGGSASTETMPAVSPLPF